jgi:transcriptional regulator, MarR family
MPEIKKLHKALIFSSAAHRKVCRSEFQKLNLSEGQPKVLEALSEKEGYLQKDLAARCHVEPATMTIILTNMEKRGYIRRETAHVSGGKRAFAVYLTDAGREAAALVENIVCDVEQVGLEGFSDEEKTQFMDYLKRLGNNLTATLNK